MNKIIAWMNGGKFNNQRKIKIRYIQHEKILMMEHGRYYVKSCEDNPATVQRRIRRYRTHSKELRNVKRLML